MCFYHCPDDTSSKYASNAWHGGSPIKWIRIIRICGIYQIFIEHAALMQFWIILFQWRIIPICRCYAAFTNSILSSSLVSQIQEHFFKLKKQRNSKIIVAVRFSSVEEYDENLSSPASVGVSCMNQVFAVISFWMFWKLLHSFSVYPLHVKELEVYKLIVNELAPCSNEKQIWIPYIIDFYRFWAPF